MGRLLQKRSQPKALRRSRTQMTTVRRNGQTSETMSNNIAEEKGPECEREVPVSKRDRVNKLACRLRKMMLVPMVNRKPLVMKVSRMQIELTKLRKHNRQKVGPARMNRGARQRDSGSENSRSEKNEDEGARGQPQNDAKGNRG